MDWPDDTEKKIHRYCAPERTTGEWFKTAERSRSIEVLYLMGRGLDGLGAFIKIYENTPWHVD